MQILLFLLPLVLGIYCLVEAISSRDDEVRNLSKVWWILLILFFPFVGSIAWLAAGRPVRTPRRLGPHERSANEFPDRQTRERKTPGSDSQGHASSPARAVAVMTRKLYAPRQAR